jgi:hypothetical protein
MGKVQKQDSSRLYRMYSNKTCSCFICNLAETAFPATTLRLSFETHWLWMSVRGQTITNKLGISWWFSSITDRVFWRNGFEYCNVLVGSISQWNFITLKIQYTTINYNTSNTRPTSARPIYSRSRTQLPSSVKISHIAVSIVMFPFTLLRYCNKSIVMPQELLRYYGNATNSLLCNRSITLLWKCNRLHRSCHQGNLICNNILNRKTKTTTTYTRKLHNFDSANYP